MGKWLVDGEDISNLAYNVRTRAGTWRVPGRRGENSQTQNRHGATYIPGKPYDEGQVSYSMFAVGALPDGTVPSSSEQLCKTNVEKLIQLFTKDTGLVELTRIDSAGYGSVNLYGNPGFEMGGSTATLYENKVTNPELDYPTSQTWLRNLFTNPTLASASAFQYNGESLTMDAQSKKYRSATQNLNELNYIAPQGGEGQTIGSAVGSGWTYTNAAGTWQTSNGEGTVAWRILSTAALAANAVFAKRSRTGFSSVVVMPYLRFIVRRNQVTTNTRTLKWRWVWVDNSNATISALATQTVTLPINGAWTYVYMPSSFFGTTPPGSTGFTLEFQAGEAWTSGDGIQIDGLTVGKTGLLGRDKNPPALAGSDPWMAWGSTAENSTSSWLSQVIDPRWTIPVYNCFHAYAVTPSTDSGGTLIGFIAYGDLTDMPATQSYRLPLAEATPGEVYCLTLLWRALSGVTWSAKVIGSTDGTTWVTKSATITGTGSATAAASGTWMTGGTTDAVVDGFVGVAGEELMLEVTVPVANNGYHQVQILSMGVNSGTTGRYVGDSASSANAQYSWAGAQYESKSIQETRAAVGILTRSIYNGIDTNFARYNSALLDYMGAAGWTYLETANIAVGANEILNGIYVTARAAWISYRSTVQPTVRAVIVAYDASDAIVQTTNGTALPVFQLTAAKEEYTLLTVSAPTLPASTAYVRARFEITNPIAGHGVFVSQIQVLDRNYTAAATLLAGGAASDMLWEGTANASVSKQVANMPTGWYPVRGVAKPRAGSSYLPLSGVSNNFEVSAGTAVSIPSGTVLLGARVSSTRAALVYAQLWSGSTMLTETLLGRIGASTATPIFQASETTASAATELRIVVRRGSSNFDPTDDVNISAGYAIPAAGSGLPRLLANQLSNGDMLGGTWDWSRVGPFAATETSNLAPSTYNNLPTVKVSAAGGNLFNRSMIPVVPGQTLVIAGRFNSEIPVAAMGAAFYTSGGVLVSMTPVATSIDGVGKVASAHGTVTVPATAAYGTWYSTGGATGTYHVIAAFLGIVAAGRDYGPDIDPWRWLGIQGTSGDGQGLPTAWNGTAGSSTTRAIATRPSRVTSTSAMSVVKQSYMAPPGSKNRVLVFPQNPGLQTADTELVEAPDAYTSGEIAYARTSGTLTVSLMAANGPGDPSPVVLQTETVAGTSGRFAWSNVANPRTHVFLRIDFTGTRTGGQFEAMLDNLLILSHPVQLGADYPGYFDGSSGVSAWNGSANDSPSTFLGGARRAYAECVAPVAAESMAGATRAEVEFTMQIPSVFWEDLILSTFVVDMTLATQTIDLDVFAFGTAPLEDATVTFELLSGTVTATDGIRIADVHGGSWVQVKKALAAGNTLVVDAGTQRLSSNAYTEASLVTAFTKGGNSRFLTLNSPGYGLPPQVQVDTPGLSGTLRMTIVGRRKFKVA